MGVVREYFKFIPERRKLREKGLAKEPGDSPSQKVYICDNCSEKKGSREDIRDHVKKCQSNWSGNHIREDERKPLSDRYYSKVIS